MNYLYAHYGAEKPLKFKDFESAEYTSKLLITEGNATSVLVVNEIGEIVQQYVAKSPKKSIK